MVGGLSGPSWDQNRSGGGSTDTTDETATGGSDDYTNDTEDIEQDQTSDDLDLGQADGGGLEYDSEDSAGNVVDSDGDPDTGGVTIISDNNSDDPATDDAQQDLTDDALNETSGDGEIPSGVVDSESGEYVDQPDNTSEPTTPADDSPPAMVGAVFVAGLLAWGVYGGD